MVRLFSLATLLVCATSLLAQEAPSASTAGASDLEAVEIEVTIVQWVKHHGEATDSPTLDDIDLPSLEKSGTIKVMERIRLSGLNQQRVYFQRGEQTPTVTGISNGPRGAQRAIQYHMVGTSISITPAIRGDKIVLETKVERSTLDTQNGPALTDEGENPKDRAAIVVSGVCQTTVAVSDGQTVLAGAIAHRSSATSRSEAVFVRARRLK